MPSGKAGLGFAVAEYIRNALGQCLLQAWLGLAGLVVVVHELLTGNEPVTVAAGDDQACIRDYSAVLRMTGEEAQILLQYLEFRWILVRVDELGAEVAGLC